MVITQRPSVLRPRFGLVSKPVDNHRTHLPETKRDRPHDCQASCLSQVPARLPEPTTHPIVTIHQQSLSHTVHACIITPTAPVSQACRYSLPVSNQHGRKLMKTAGDVHWAWHSVDGSRSVHNGGSQNKRSHRLIRMTGSKQPSLHTEVKRNITLTDLTPRPPPQKTSMPS